MPLIAAVDEVEWFFVFARSTNYEHGNPLQMIKLQRGIKRRFGFTHERIRRDDDCLLNVIGTFVYMHLLMTEA